MHVSLHCQVLPTWFACLGVSFMEVPLACFDRQGGAGRDFKSIKSLLELTLCGILLELKLVYVCGHGSKTKSRPHSPSSVQLLGICHLTVAMARINTQLAFEYVAAMGDDAFVIAMLDRIHVPSSAEEGAAVIKDFLS